MSAASTARPLSIPLIDATITDDGRGAGAGRDAGAVDGRGAGVGGAGVGACIAATGAAAAGLATAGAAAAGAAGAGILIVGAEVGLGGKLIRTVSFFGCTLAASVGLGGTAPEGVLGMFSAINVSEVQRRVH